VQRAQATAEAGEQEERAESEHGQDEGAGVGGGIDEGAYGAARLVA
jgi:hypothetical protein